MANADTLETLFNDDNLGEEVSTPEEQVTVAPPKAAKKNVSVIEAEVSKAIAEDPSVVEKMSLRSDDLEVTNIYYTYLVGNIKPDKTQPKRDNGRYPVVKTSYKAGYAVKNVSDQPIQYLKPNYVLNPETGRYEDQAFEATLAPGEEVILDRLNMVKLIARPEFSNKTKNGKLLRSSKTNVESKEEFIRSYYFKYADEIGISVNDDDIGVSIDKEGPDGTTTIADEYLQTFGYILNTKEKKERVPRSSSGKRKISAQEASALYLMRVIEGKAAADVNASEK